VKGLILHYINMAEFGNLNHSILHIFCDLKVFSRLHRCCWRSAIWTILHCINVFEFGNLKHSMLLIFGNSKHGTWYYWWSEGPSLSWSYGSWIDLCNQCLSQLTLWVQTMFIARCTWYNIQQTRNVLKWNLKL
jgi:hypothetical protein